MATNVANSSGNDAMQSSSSEQPQTFNADTVALVIPENPTQKADFLKTEGRVILRNVLIKYQKNYDRAPVTPREYEEARIVLRALINIDDLTKDMEKKIGLKDMLERLANNPKLQLPTELKDTLNEGILRYQAINWGLDPNQELLDEESTAAPSAATLPTASRSSQSARYVARAPRRHPIFGENGIMRGILVNRSGSVTSYLLDDTFPRTRNFRVPGANGFTVGDWWPMQICVLRDGAHGGKMKGISGSVTEGAVSIVVSGGYEGMDSDQGDVILYSGSDSHQNTDPAQPRLSKDTLALRTSYQRRVDIRVIRTSRSNWAGSPLVGYRYDGLYRITSESVEQNGKGGAYLRFRLERKAGQPGIDRSRPTLAEQRQFEEIKEYY